jgi:hypothetical protein
LSPRRPSIAEDLLDDAQQTAELLALEIGQLAGAASSGRFQRLRSYLADVKAGRADTPIGLFLSVDEVLEFLDAIDHASKVAIRLHDLAMSRDEAPDGEPR